MRNICLATCSLLRQSHICNFNCNMKSFVRNSCHKQKSSLINKLKTKWKLDRPCYDLVTYVGQCLNNQWLKMFCFVLVFVFCVLIFYAIKQNHKDWITWQNQIIFKKITFFLTELQYTYQLFASLWLMILIRLVMHWTQARRMSRRTTILNC